DVADALAEAAGGDVVTGDVDGAGLGGLAAFAREAAREPVGLTGDVVVDVWESHGGEPARGSWAHVSQRVEAVNDHRAAPVELGGRLGPELLERNVERAWQVLVCVFVGRKDLDELSAPVEELAQPGEA